MVKVCHFINKLLYNCNICLYDEWQMCLNPSHEVISSFSYSTSCPDLKTSLNISLSDRLYRLSCVSPIKYQFNLADTVQDTLYQAIVRWHILGWNCDEHGGKNNNSSHTKSHLYINRFFPSAHVPPPLIHHHCEGCIWMTILYAVQSHSCPFFLFFIKQSGLAQGQQSGNTVWCQHGKGKVK